MNLFVSHSTSYLQSVEPAALQRRHRIFQNLRRFFILLLLVVGIYAGFAAVMGVQAMAEMADGRDQLLLARQSAIELSLASAQEELLSADESFDKARRRLVLLRPLTILPIIGQGLSDATDLFLATADIVDSFTSLLDLTRDLLQIAGLSEEYLQDVQLGLEPSTTFEDLSSQTKQRVLERLTVSSDDLELLLTRMYLIEEELSLLTTEDFLSPVLAVSQELLVDLAQIREYLETVTIVAKVLPDLAGVGQERTHLLLFLNNNELRPGGGFIGSYGVLSMFNGDIVHLQSADSYLIDDAAQDDVLELAPMPLQRYNATTHWLFRDSNWSPDFAVSSLETIKKFLFEVSVLTEEEKESTPTTTRVDGVIALTPTYVSELLKITGDLTVSGQTFTTDNIADQLEYQVQKGFQDDGLPYKQRKEILADLVNAMKTELFALPVSKWGAVLEVSKDAFKNKQLVLYSSDQETEEIYTLAGWGGRVLAETVDTQMVVDANLASLKTDPVVERQMSYELGKNKSGEWVGRTTVHYTHTANFDWKTTRYRTYTRLFVPLGTELVRVEGSLLDDVLHNPTGVAGPVDVGEELGMTVFGVFTSIEPLSTGDLVFEYRLSDQVVSAIQDNTYSLTVFKQIGALDQALTLDLDFDKNVSQATPAEQSDNWGDDTFTLNTILDQDLEFYVAL